MNETLVRIVSVIVIAIIVYPLGKIIEKAGYSFWLVLPFGVFFPLMPIFFYILAFHKWPIEEELAHYKGRFGKGECNGSAVNE